MTQIFLASTSPARRKILAQIGIEATIVSPEVDEKAETQRMAIARTAQNISLHLAKLKAASAVTESRRGLILGADSVFEFDGEILGKPETAASATKRWKAMRGKKGTLYSGLWLIDNTSSGKSTEAGALAHGVVQFSENISNSDIEAYISTGEPLGVAGAFTLDCLGAPFIEHVEGDPWAIVGLSVFAFRETVQKLGYDFKSLWSNRKMNEK